MSLAVAAKHDLDGKRLWIRWLGEPPRPMNGNPYGHAASPILVGAGAAMRLIVPFGRLQALDPSDGHVIWAAAEPYRDFGTPAVLRPSSRDPLIISPDGAIHRASDGTLLEARVDPVWFNGPIAEELASPASEDEVEKPYSPAELALLTRAGQRR